MLEKFSKTLLSKKSLLIPYFAIGAFIDPTRGDFVAGLGDITGSYILIKI
jgi:hypothetical protein